MMLVAALALMVVAFVIVRDSDFFMYRGGFLAFALISAACGGATALSSGQWIVRALDFEPIRSDPSQENVASQRWLGCADGWGADCWRRDCVHDGCPRAGRLILCIGSSGSRRACARRWRIRGTTTDCPCAG